MAHAREHDRSLFDVALDPVAHFEESLRGKPHLARAPDLEIGWRGPAPAEPVGGVGKRLDRPDLIAQKQNGDDEQNGGGDDHPDEEDVGVGRQELCPGRQHPHHRPVKLDPDLDMR